jgi:hypothetical protein
MNSFVRGPSGRNAKREAVKTWPRTRGPDSPHHNEPEGSLKMVRTWRQAAMSQTVMSETRSARRHEDYFAATAGAALAA